VSTFQHHKLRVMDPVVFYEVLCVFVAIESNEIEGAVKTEFLNVDFTGQSHEMES
jgi:hypothetical protein